MDDLAQWLGEQLDEDERRAKGATPGPWRHNPDKHHHLAGTPMFEEAVFAGSSGGDATCVAGTGPTDDRQSMRDAAFIAEHDPRRVLREIDAKRQILRQHETVREQARHPVSAENRMRARVEQGALEDVLRALALPYADRPGYRDEWRP